MMSKGTPSIKHIIQIHPQNVGDTVKIAVNSNGKFLSVEGDENHFTVEHEFGLLRDDNTFKTTNIVPSKKIHDTNNITFKEFDEIYSIDTGIRKINGMTAYLGIAIRWGKEKYFIKHLTPVLCVGELKKPENFMWGYTLSRDNSNGLIDINKKTAIIVDAEKDEHYDYNNGEIFTDEIKGEGAIVSLPKNFKFVYAKEMQKKSGLSLENEYIALCHLVAEDLLNIIEAKNPKNHNEIVAEYNKSLKQVPKLIEKHSKEGW